MDNKVKVTNRSNGYVVYRIPDERIRKEFQPHESKLIDYDELLSVVQQPGGRELIYNYLYIEDKEVLKNITNVKPEIEYDLTEDKIPNWIVTCTLDQFKDALDFAPTGVKDLIKKFAVSVPLTDTRKIDALKNQLGFDCLRAIQNENETNNDDNDNDDQPIRIDDKRRRAQEPVTQERRTTASKYKRVTSDD